MAKIKAVDFILIRNLFLTSCLRCYKPEFFLILSSDSTSRWMHDFALYFPLSYRFGTFTHYNMYPPDTQSKALLIMNSAYSQLPMIGIEYS